MGQASRAGLKSKADASFRLGGLGAALGGVVGRAGQQIASRANNAARTVAPRIQAMPPPSRPIPSQQAQYFAARPFDNPHPPSSDIRDQIQKVYNSVGTFGKQLGNVVGHSDKQAEEKKYLDVASEVQRGFQNATDSVASIGNGLREHPYVAPERPNELTLQQIRDNVDIAMRDGAWTPQEKEQILGSYRNFVQKFVADDEEDAKSLNNWAVQSAYNQLKAKFHQEKDAAQATGGGNPFGDLFGLATDKPKDDLGRFYSGTLNSSGDDKFGPGFILSADNGGWYKIESIETVQHAIGTHARDDPAFAARLIAGMASYGAYGAGTDKYAGQRIQYDKRGNPVAATFNVDDDNALTTFLGLIAKDQEMAMNSQELKPWDQIMDEHALQNRNIAASPAYGEQAGPGAGYRGARFGGGGYGGGYGGGGGGGISYTDSDQLKQLINGIARSRLGYVLNDQQIAEFVGDYHSKEAAFVNARMTGGSGQQLDPESQAASWIEGHFRDAMASNQANNYISSLASFLLGGSFGSTS